MIEYRPELKTEREIRLEVEVAFTFTPEIVAKPVYSMKKSRGTESGRERPELMKHKGQYQLIRTTDFLNTTVWKCQILKQFESHLVIPFKKGKKKNPNNYKGLSSTSKMNRLFGKMLKNHLEHEVENFIEKDQLFYSRIARS